MKRTWRHPSVVRIIKEYRERSEFDADPEDIIRQKARRLIQYATAHGWSGPPFDPHFLAGLIGIKVKSIDLPDFIDAMIVPDEGGLIILLNSKISQHERQNFSVCHEIAHTFFPDHADFILMRAKNPDRADPDREVETLCNIAASELLLPGDYFIESLREHGFSLKSVQPLAELYSASKMATIIKMVGTGTKVCAAIFLEPGFRKNRRWMKEEPKMRVVYSIPSPGFKYYIPRNKSVPDSSCVYRVINSNEITSGVEDWKIPGHPVYTVEAMNLPPMIETDQTQRAVAFLEVG